MRRDSNRDLARGRIGIAARAAFAVTLVCVTATLGSAFGGERRSTGGVVPAFFTGEETIGTLPILQGPETIELRRDLRITRPALCLEGDLADVMNAIVSVRGGALAQVENVGAHTTRVRVIFTSDVQLAFDRLQVESSSIRIGLWTPGRPEKSEITGVWSSRQATFVARTSFVELPVLALSSTGALSYAPFLAKAQGVLGPTFLTAATVGESLVLRQTH